MDFYISNQIKPGTDGERRYLKSIYGDNWKEGARKNPHIGKHDPGMAARVQEQKKQAKEQGINGIMKSSILDMKTRGEISGSQAHEMIKAVE